MASGILGQADLSAATNTSLYTVPSAKVASVAVNFCNRNTASVAVRLAVSTSGTPSNTDWLLYDVIVQGNGVLEKTGIVLDAGKIIVAYSNTANVTAIACGYEE